MSQPGVHISRAKALLAVAKGKSYTQAAERAGYRVGDTVSKLVNRFNQEGMAALQPRHGGGTPASYGVEETERILAEVRRLPAHNEDGTATWSLSLRHPPAYVRLQMAYRMSAPTRFGVSYTRRGTTGRRVELGVKPAKSSASVSVVS